MNSTLNGPRSNSLSQIDGVNPVRPERARLLLTVSAVALGLIAAVQIGTKLGAGSPEPAALAEMAASVGEYTLMTTASNDNEEQLFVLDNRNEQLMVYGVNQNAGLKLEARESLSQVFAAARAAAGGRR
ncbi:MAG: hypothetical protein AAFR96_01680 [Planctomycetota bacterium]